MNTPTTPKDGSAGQNSDTQKRAPKKWYICERHNPQLGIYYIRDGRLSKTAAKRKEKSIYGSNVMLPFDSEEEYETEIKRLETAGHKVQP